MAIALVFQNGILAFAASSIPLDGQVFTESGLPTPPGEGTDGQVIAVQLAFGALKYAKALTVVLGILFVTILGLQMVMANGNEEDITKSKRGLIYMIIAFLLISMSQDLAKIFDQSGSTILAGGQSILNRVNLFSKQVEILMVLIKILLGGIASLMLVRSGVGFVVSGDSEEDNTNYKKGIFFSSIGLIMIFIGDIFINRVFYKVDQNLYSGISGVQPGVDVKEGVEQLAGIANFIVTLIAPLAFIMLIAGSIIYVTSGGNEENTEKGKRIIIATVIGIIVVYGAFAFVSTIINSRLTELGTIVT